MRTMLISLKTPIFLPICTGSYQGTAPIRSWRKQRRKNNWYKYGHTVRLDCVTVIFAMLLHGKNKKCAISSPLWGNRKWCTKTSCAGICAFPWRDAQAWSFLPIFSWIHRKSNRWFHYESAAFFVLQKIFEFFSLRESINEPSRCLPIEGQNEFPHEPWKSNTHSTGTFLIGGESPSRMKVRHELPAHKGYHGKQGW